jgi:DNA repair exonuclease SbcCD nuclease subunit
LSLTDSKDVLGVTPIRDTGTSNLLTRLKEMAMENGQLFQRLNQAYPSDRDLGVLLSDPSEQEHVLAWLAEHLELLEEPAEAGRSDLLSTDEGDESYLSLARGFRLDETKLLEDAANKLLDPSSETGVKLVIMGHTHEPVEKPKGLSYYNTGSWTRYYRFNDDDHPSAWSILREQSYVNFPYELNYVDVDIDLPSAAKMICYKRQDHD